MKKLLFFLLIIISSCNNKFTGSTSSPDRFHRKRIAVLPFQIHTTVDELPEGITLEMINNNEKEKSNILQLHLFRYMLRAYANSSRRVILQHYNDTNKILKKRGLKYDDLFNIPKNKLARILKVDALVYGNIYQFKKKIELDGKEDVKYKGNNSISTVIYVYGKGKREKILWKDDRATSGFPSDYAADASKNLLRKAAKSFPFN